MSSLEAQVEKLPKHGIVLVITSAKNYHAINTLILKQYLNALGKQCIYVSMNRPASSMQRILGEEGINSRRVFFIDGVTGIAEPHGMTRAGNIIFLTSPQNLTDLSIAITEAATAMRTGERFLFFDSLSTLALYNAAESVSRFVHFLTAKLRELEISAVFLLLEKEAEPRVLSQLSQFCDKVIEIK